MNLEEFIEGLRSKKDFSDEEILEVKESLADLYIATCIPYKVTSKSTYGGSTVSKKMGYWEYSEEIEEALRRDGFIDTFTIYSKEGYNCHFITLAKEESKIAIAKEAFLKCRFNENNRNFLDELIKKYKYLLPILSYGYTIFRQTGEHLRFSFPHDYSLEKIPVLEDEWEFIVQAKAGSPLEPSSENLEEKVKNKKRFKLMGFDEFIKYSSEKQKNLKGVKQWHKGPHTAEELKKKLNALFKLAKLDITFMTFQSLVQTKEVIKEVNDFFNQLDKKKLVLLLPDFNSSRVFDDYKVWVLPNKLLEVIKEKSKKEMTQEQAEKIKEIVKGYIEILLLYLQKKKGFTEDQILSIVKAIVEENRDLNFSDSDFEKINFSFPDIEYGGNKINWDESIKTSLEKLGLEAINLFKGKEK